MAAEGESKGEQAAEVQGEFWMFGNYDFSTDPTTATTSFVKAEANFIYSLDKFTTVKLEIDSEGTGFPTVAVDDFRIESDLGGALNLPVKLKATFGYFDTYFTDWDYVSAMGWESYYGTYNWPNMLATPPYGPETGGGGAPDTAGAWQVDLGVGPVTLHWWNNFPWTEMLVGLSAAAGPVSGWLTYQDLFVDGFGNGVIGVEAKYSGKMGDLALAVPAFFRYDLLSKAYTFGAGVGVDYKIAHVAFGLEGSDVKIPNHMVVEASVVPMAGFKAMATAYFAMADYALADTQSAFTAAVIELEKDIGKLKAILGYVIGGEDKIGITVYGDNFGVTNGLYFGLATTY